MEHKDMRTREDRHTLESIVAHGIRVCEVRRDAIFEQIKVDRKSLVAKRLIQLAIRANGYTWADACRMTGVSFHSKHYPQWQKFCQTTLIESDVLSKWRKMAPKELQRTCTYNEINKYGIDLMRRFVANERADEAIERREVREMVFSGDENMSSISSQPKEVQYSSMITRGSERLREAIRLHHPEVIRAAIAQGRLTPDGEIPRPNRV